MKSRSQSAVGAAAVAVLGLAAFVVATDSSSGRHSASPGRVGLGGFVVNSAADAPDSAPGDHVCAAARGACTLRAALMEAAFATAPSTISLSAGTYQLGLAPDGTRPAGATGALAAKANVTITGAGPALTRIDGHGLDRVLTVTDGAFLTMTGVTVTGGNSPAEGGGVFVGDGVLVMSNSAVTGNTASGDGGGIFETGPFSSVSLTDVAVSNDSGLSGGGLFVERGALMLRGATLDGDTALDKGGALAASYASALSIASTTFSHDQAMGSGGGVWIDGGTSANARERPTFAITGSTFRSDTSAGGEGGGLAIASMHASPDSATLTVDGSTFTGNQAARGGGLALDDGAVTLTKDTFTSNVAADSPDGPAGQGGAVWAWGSLTIQDGTFTSNSATALGGAIDAEGSYTATGAASFHENAPDDVHKRR